MINYIIYIYGLSIKNNIYINISLNLINIYKNHNNNIKVPKNIFYIS